jgi:hypothetical protein
MVGDTLIRRDRIVVVSFDRSSDVSNAYDELDGASTFTFGDDDARARGSRFCR